MTSNCKTHTHVNTHTLTHTNTHKHGAHAAVPWDPSYIWRDQTCLKSFFFLDDPLSLLQIPACLFAFYYLHHEDVKWLKIRKDEWATVKKHSFILWTCSFLFACYLTHARQRVLRWKHQIECKEIKVMTKSNGRTRIALFHIKNSQ